MSRRLSPRFNRGRVSKPTVAFAAPPAPPATPNTQDNIGVNNANDNVQVNDVNDKVEVGL